MIAVYPSRFVIHLNVPSFTLVLFYTLCPDLADRRHLSSLDLALAVPSEVAFRSTLDSTLIHSSVPSILGLVICSTEARAWTRDTTVRSHSLLSVSP